MSHDDSDFPSAAAVRDHLRKSYDEVRNQLPREQFGFDALWGQARSRGQVESATRFGFSRRMKLGFSLALASIAFVVSTQLRFPGSSAAYRIVVPSEIKQLTVLARDGWDSELLKTDTGFVRVEYSDYELEWPRIEIQLNKKGS